MLTLQSKGHYTESSSYQLPSNLPEYIKLSGPKPEQCRTTGVGACPCSGAVLKVLYNTIQPIRLCLGRVPCSSPGDS